MKITHKISISVLNHVGILQLWSRSCLKSPPACVPYTQRAGPFPGLAISSSHSFLTNDAHFMPGMQRRADEAQLRPL